MESRIGLNVLPDEILLQIINFLAPEDLLILRKVCIKYNFFSIESIFQHTDASSIQLQKKLLQYAAETHSNLRISKTLILKAMQRSEFDIMSRVYGLLVIANQENIDLEIDIVDYAQLLFRIEKYAEETSTLQAFALALKPPQVSNIFRAIMKNEGLSDPGKYHFLTTIGSVLAIHECKKALQILKIPTTHWLSRKRMWDFLSSISNKADRPEFNDILSAFTNNDVIINGLYDKDCDVRKATYLFLQNIVHKLDPSQIEHIFEETIAKLKNEKNAYIYHASGLNILATLIPYLNPDKLQIAKDISLGSGVFSPYDRQINHAGRNALNKVLQNMKAKDIVNLTELALKKMSNTRIDDRLYATNILLVTMPLLKEDERQKFLSFLIKQASDTDYLERMLEILSNINFKQHEDLLSCILIHLSSNVTCDKILAQKLFTLIGEQLTTNQINSVFEDLINNISGNESRMTEQGALEAISTTIGKLNPDQIKTLIVAVKNKLFNTNDSNVIIAGFSCLQKLAPSLDTDNVTELLPHVMTLLSPVFCIIHREALQVLKNLAPKLTIVQIDKLCADALIQIQDPAHHIKYTGLYILQAIGHRLTQTQFENVLNKVIEQFKDITAMTLREIAIDFIRENINRLDSDQIKKVFDQLLPMMTDHSLKIKTSSRDMMSSLMFSNHTELDATKDTSIVFSYFEKWHKEVTDKKTFQARQQYDQFVQSFKSLCENNMSFFKQPLKTDYLPPIMEISEPNTKMEIG